jgi:hypothetical protein
VGSFKSPISLRFPLYPRASSFRNPAAFFADGGDARLPIGSHLLFACLSSPAPLEFEILNLKFEIAI